MGGEGRKKQKERSNVTTGDWEGTNFCEATKTLPFKGGFLWR